MKENEYDNGYIERQTVSSNPPGTPSDQGLRVRELLRTETTRRC